MTIFVLVREIIGTMVDILQEDIDDKTSDRYIRASEAMTNRGGIS